DFVANSRAIGDKSQRSDAPCHRNRASSRVLNTFPSGFTLIEIMVVMALMALLVGLVPIAFGRLNEAAQYRDTVRAVLTDMRTARYLAQSEGEEVRFAVNIRERSFGIEGRPPHTVPEHLQMRAVMAQQEVGADGEMAIRF